MFNINNLVRSNIEKLLPYSSARSEFSGKASVFLDANENSFGSPLSKNYHRYPDPLQKKLKEKISEIKDVHSARIFLGNGSDECIDLLFRAFCNPGKDNVIICPPTYGMYKVSAGINDVEVREAELNEGFQLQPDLINSLIDADTKMIFICSPNNPTGNAIEREDIKMLLEKFKGLVVIDEAYINFSRYRSFVLDLIKYPNMVVLQTFSKAWGLAALRLGILFGSSSIINILNKIKPPYNINQVTQELAIEALGNIEKVNEKTKNIVIERESLKIDLRELPFVKQIYPSDANFLLVKMDHASTKYDALVDEGIIVRDRSNVILCDDCLRITVGTPEENGRLLQAFKKIE